MLLMRSRKPIYCLIFATSSVLGSVQAPHCMSQGNIEWDKTSFSANIPFFISWMAALAYPWTRVRAPVAAASLAICRQRSHREISGAQGVLPMRVGDAACQLDLPSLKPLSVAGCGRLQLGVPHWATSISLPQVVDNWPPHSVVVDSPVGGSWP